MVLSGSDSGTDLQQCEEGDVGCCDTSFGVGRFGAQKRCTHKPGSFLSQLGGCCPRWCAHATQKVLLSWFVTWKATQTLQVLQRLSTWQGHRDSGLRTSFLAFTLCLVLDPRHGPPDTFEPGTQQQGWQDEPSSRYRRVRPQCVVHKVASTNCCHHAARGGWALESVVARVCCEAGLVTTNVSDLDMAFLMWPMVGGWRWLLMGFHSSAGFPSTPLLCAPSAEMVTRRTHQLERTHPELVNRRARRHVGRSCCGGGGAELLVPTR